MHAPTLSLPAADPVARRASVRAVLSDPNFAVEVLTDLDALETAGPEWRALEATSPAAALFQSHAQTMIWARHFLTGDAARRLHVVLVRAGGEARLILPLVLSRFAGATVGSIAGAPIAQYAELLGDPGADLESAFRAALASLRAAGIDMLALRGVREDSLLLATARPLLRAARDRRVAPFARLDMTPDHDAFVRSRSKDLLHGIRNRRKRLERDGTVAWEVFDGGPAARRAIGEAVGLKLDWLQQHGQVSTAFMDARSTDCLLDLAEHAPGAVVMRLGCNGKPAAIRFGFERQGTYFAYLSAYDTELARYAPGKLLLNYCIEEERKRGSTVIDMLAPAGEHKTLWCDEATPVADYVLPLSLKGATLAVARERFRQVAEWGWHHLPAAVRSRVARRVLRR
jgi:CelD/BcsL family acetyltransferase involved in cellulose biosynthesis